MVSSPITGEGRHGLVVRIRDRSTGAPTADGASVVIADGDYVEELSRFNAELLSGAVERPGKYRVTVRKPGYILWERAGVLVARSGPHVSATVVEVELEREGNRGELH